MKWHFEILLEYTKVEIIKVTHLKYYNEERDINKER